MSINSSKTSFTNKWIQYGKENEATARSYYTKYQRAIHDNFKCSESGLILNRDYPRLGASPDGLAQCDCCGQGCLEIKCLPTYMNGIPDPLGETCTSFPISSDFQLKKTHKYSILKFKGICSLLAESIVTFTCGPSQTAWL